jgi:lysophospholipase L1-like esterase
VPADVIDFLPLGDSYTIGISVDPADRWPDQLVGVLAGTVALRIVANPARNGLTSGDLLRDELPLVARLKPGLVSVLIGVNDVVQGVSEQGYRGNVTQILDSLVRAPGVGRTFVVATPDYTLTPQGAAFGDPKANRGAITRFNAIIREEAERRYIAYVDITPVADGVTTDRSLVAGDGLHPSGLKYLARAESIAPVVASLLTLSGDPEP